MKNEKHKSWRDQPPLYTQVPTTRSGYLVKYTGVSFEDSRQGCVHRSMSTAISKACCEIASRLSMIQWAEFAVFWHCNVNFAQCFRLVRSLGSKKRNECFRNNCRMKIRAKRVSACLFCMKTLGATRFEQVLLAWLGLLAGAFGWGSLPKYFVQ